MLVTRSSCWTTCAPAAQLLSQTAQPSSLAICVMVQFIQDVLARTKPDAIMHFAAATIVPESVLKPDLYYGINMVGGYNLLEGARLAGCR